MFTQLQQLLTSTLKVLHIQNLFPTVVFFKLFSTVFIVVFESSGGLVIVGKPEEKK